MLLHQLIVSGVQGRSFKTDGGFNEVMSKIADKHPNSPLADKVNKTDTIAQNKVRNVAKKHKLIDVGGQNLGQNIKRINPLDYININKTYEVQINLFTLSTHTKKRSGW